MGSEPVRLQRVLPAVARSEGGRWPGGSFEVQLEADLPVAGDATYVEQVVRNRLANAMKYGGPDSRATVQANEAGGEVLVRVLDEAPGFPADEADRLFELAAESDEDSRRDRCQRQDRLEAAHGSDGAVHGHGRAWLEGRAGRAPAQVQAPREAAVDDGVEAHGFAPSLLSDLGCSFAMHTLGDGRNRAR
jgi:light-regulated signal transduction histidine kinase (bacteriophytochrome)